jgi:hypothetical protein
VGFGAKAQFDKLCRGKEVTRSERTLELFELEGSVHFDDLALVKA